MTEKRKVQRTLEVVRYSTEELKEFIVDQFYENVATCTSMFFMDKVVDQGKIRPRSRLEQRMKRIEDIKYRIKDFERRREMEKAEADKQVYTEGIEILTEKLFLEEHFDMEYQKKEYELTGDVFCSRTFTEFPLNKMINSIYDDFNAIVLFYDDLTNDEIISKLENAETLEEKKQIVKDNVEITHILMAMNNNSRASIALQGKLDELYSDTTNSNAQVLPIKYSDFNKITLEDCEAIANNDLAQIVQERIDMKKENLIEEARLTIKGEEYIIYKSPYTDREYIHYVCPSTQREYYNVLKFSYLSESKYYKENDPESYIKAWYSIANLFLELTDEEISKPSIAC